jgi:hypothetical protein
MEDKQLFVKMVLDSFRNQIKLVNNILAKLSDDQLENEVSPTRNRGIYILGHLAAVHDLMLPLLRFEESIYPDLQPIFFGAPDRSTTSMPSVEQVKKQWNDVNDKLLFHFDNLPAEEWFTRHASVSQEDFEKEPSRNRLNVLIGRTLHTSYHRGQLAFLVKRAIPVPG